MKTACLLIICILVDTVIRSGERQGARAVDESAGAQGIRAALPATAGEVLWQVRTGLRRDHHWGLC